MKPYYEHGGITIYHGDCREVFFSLAGIDAVVTDPPYGIGASTGVGKYGRDKWGGPNDLKWDAAPPDVETLRAMITKAPYSIVWGMNYFALPPTRNYLVWDKGAGFADRSFAECELAWCSWDANAKIFKRDPLAARDYRRKTHPTQKPVSLMRWCIGLIPGHPRTILDTYMGSGSTLVAAKELGLRAIGVEAVEKYCEDAARRLAQETLICA